MSEGQPQATQEVVEGATAPVAESRAADKQTAAEPTVDELRALLDKERKDRQEANKEAQTMRAKLRELEKAEEERTLAAMSEQERIKVELEAARTELETVKAARLEAMLKADVATAAAKHGIVDTEAAYKLMDREKIKFDETGAPTNVQDVIAELAQAKPYLTLAGGTGFTNAERGAGAVVGKEEELRHMLYGSGPSIFDVETVQLHGGGVRTFEKV